MCSRKRLKCQYLALKHIHNASPLWECWILKETTLQKWPLAEVKMSFSSEKAACGKVLSRRVFPGSQRNRETQPKESRKASRSRYLSCQWLAGWLGVSLQVIRVFQVSKTFLGATLFCKVSFGCSKCLWIDRVPLSLAKQSWPGLVDHLGKTPKGMQIAPFFCSTIGLTYRCLLLIWLYTLYRYPIPSYYC